MTKRCLALLSLVLSIGGARASAATIVATPSPLAFGAVAVGQASTASTTLAATPPITIVTLELATTTDCAQFQIMTASPLTPGSGTPVTVRLAATSSGAKTCDVIVKEAGTEIGRFAATGTASAPTLTVAPTSFDFGDVRVANAAVTTATKQFTISNTGDVGTTLHVSNIVLSSADYALNPAVTFPLVLARGASTTVTVEFDPSTAGAHPATMDLVSDDPLTPTRTVTLAGTGTTAIIAPSDLDFGVVPNGSTSNSGVAIANSATASRGVLTVTGATISGGGGFFSFGTTQGCSGGTACTFTQPFTVTAGTIAAPVRCQPPAAAAGTQMATVTFASDSDSSATTTAQLTCTAGRSNIVVSTNTLAFGAVAVGAPSAAQTVTIMNTGTSDLTYTLTKSPNAAQYAISGCTAACVIAASSIRTFDTTFTPTAIGALPIQISVTSNDPDPGDNTFTINVTGTGSAPQISVAPGTLGFGSVEVGRTSAAQVVTATNTGNAPLTISSATLVTGAADYTVALTSGTLVLAAGASATWDVKCKPSSQGARPGKLRFASDSLTGATTDVTLTCSGDQGIVTTIPTSLDFGGVAQGSTKTLTFTLKNTGNVAITGITGVLDPTNVGYTFNGASVPGTLAAGQSQSLDVTFAPQSGNDGGPATITFTAAWGATGLTTTAVLTLNGDGLVAGYDITPAMAFDFGNFRFDTAPTRVYQIVNTGQADVTILTQAFTPDPGTATTELGVTIRSGAAIVALPQTLAPGAQLQVTLTALPNNRIGLVAGHLDIHSSLTMNPDRRVTVTGNATTAAITAPATVAFGAVDVDGAPPTQTITIANTGVAALDITSITPMTGASPAFAVTLPTGLTQVAPGSNLPLTITYTPTVERPPNQFDTTVLVAALAGIAGGPTQAMITITGRGIDRHLTVGAVEQFPSAFRNPGSAAKPKAITVYNNGEASLRISAVMITGAPVWQLVDASAITIPGGAAHDFQVRFLPTMVGVAPEGQLTLVNNDNGKPMAVVRLTGNGVARNVSFGDAPIDLGYTGVGIPITAADILTVTNNDQLAGFTIHAISIDDPMFRVEAAPTDVALDPRAATRFGVTFEPTAVGDFTATASLYLDEDHERTAEVRITGHAVFVDAHGGGGCDVGGAGPGGGALLGLGLLALARRRRALLVAAAIGAVAIGAPAARAGGIDLAVFEPTPATAGTGFQLQSPEIGADGSWVARTVLSYASNPLVLSAIDAAGQPINSDAVVRRSSVLQLGGAYALAGRFELGAYLPLYVQSGDPAGDRATGFSTSPVSGTARGNLTLHAKARLWRAGALQLGASAMLALPTATKETFTGGDKPEGRLVALAAYAPGALGARLTVSANFGGVLRARAAYANLAQQSGVAWGAGASYRVLDALWATAELFGEATPSGRRQPGDAMPVSVLAPIEWLAGVSYQLERRVTIGLAAGRGVTSAAGAPDLRGVFSLAIVAGAPALPPIHPIEQPGPDVDSDGDGVVDRLDKCPAEPEDLDMFEDTDGCPDPDNDHDGIPDAQDKCPLDPEDNDGFEDTDGCPDKDNDGDGIPDAQDKCPNAPEDKDGFEDLDGCPDPDNDHDGIPDAKDKCPTAPETINGLQDDDGCPDKGDSTIVLSPDRIATLDPIQFAGAKLTKASASVLAQVAATLRAHDEIVRVRVTAHVQPSDDDAADQARSERRAQAVREWLIAWGIDKARLEPRGFGGDKPLVPADRRGAAKINDRIEFIILERK